jgi:hypothetical protein
VGFAALTATLRANASLAHRLQGGGERSEPHPAPTYFATFSPQGISFQSCLNAASVVFSSASYFAGGR